jgi:hypothetical protein
MLQGLTAKINIVSDAIRVLKANKAPKDEVEATFLGLICCPYFSKRFLRSYSFQKMLI